jgi:hypothetical protein
VTPLAIDEASPRAGAPPNLPPHAIRLLAALSAGAGLVHFANAGPHFDEWWGYGLFFLLVACAQLAWAAAVLAQPTPSRRLLLAGAVGNLAVAAVWVLSRTAGAPVGPGAGGPESVGLIDAACTAFEVLVAAVILVPLRPSRRVGAVASVAAMAVAGLSFTPIVGVTEGHESHTAHGATHDAATHGAAAHDGAAPDAASGHDHGGTDTTPPTAAQRAAADRLIADTRAAVARFADLNAVVAAGYRPITPTDERIVHYGNRAYMLDRDVLDPQRVESLVYARTSDGMVLLGAMYMMPPGEKGPEIGGSLTHWHVHDDLCIDEARLAQVARLANGSCPPGSSVQVTPEMLHVWSIDYPTGPFGELTPSAEAQVLRTLG